MLLLSMTSAVTMINCGKSIVPRSESTCSINKLYHKCNETLKGFTYAAPLIDIAQEQRMHMYSFIVNECLIYFQRIITDYFNLRS